MDSLISQFVFRIEAIYEQLSQGEIAEIIGVIGPAGVAVSRVPNMEREILFSLPAWKYIGGILHERVLTVRRKVTEEEGEAMRAALSPYMVVHLRVRVAENADLGNAQALLVGLVKLKAADPEMQELARKLQETVTFEDGVFGVFTLDRRLDSFEAATCFGGASVRLAIPAESKEDALLVAQRLWQCPSEWLEKMSDYAAREFLPLKNGAWLMEEEAEVTLEEFKERIVLEAINIVDEESFTFWYGDGDLFSGHLIWVDGNVTDGPIRAGKEG
jgi:hypothetical protein